VRGAEPEPEPEPEPEMCPTGPTRHMAEGLDVPPAAELLADRQVNGNGGVMRPGRQRHSVRCST